MALKPTEQSSKLNHAKTAICFGTSFCSASLYWESGAMGEVRQDLARQHSSESRAETWTSKPCGAAAGHAGGV